MVARRLVANWTASLQALGGAFGELVRAELAALGDDLSRSGKRLGGALLLLASALFVLFWSVALAIYVAVEVVHQWLPRWAAAAVVLAAVLVVMAVLAAVGWRRLKRLESPTVMVQRRWTSHRVWWEEQFPPEAGRGLPDNGGEGPGSAEEA